MIPAIKTLFSSALVMGLLVWSGSAAAQQVERGPYLQKPTPNGIVIKW